MFRYSSRNPFYWFILIGYLFISRSIFAHQLPSSNFTFIENKGQWNKKIKYRAFVPGGELYVEQKGLTYNLHNSPGHAGIKGDGISKSHSYNISFENCNSMALINAMNKKDEHYNFFIGKDQSKWASEAKAFGRIFYNEIYPNIDFEMYSREGALKYDFTVNPGGDPFKIALKYTGASKLYLDQGKLYIKTILGEIIEKSPFTYQYKNGRLIEIQCDFILNGTTLSFSLPKGYDKDLPLVIDPELIFSTYSGSVSDNFGYTATYDPEGYLYSGSSAFGQRYPTTTGAVQEKWMGGRTDIAITKYDTTGTKIIWSTFLGGSGDELPHSLVVNGYGDLYVFGTTGSADFPVTEKAYDTIFGGGKYAYMYGLSVIYDKGSDIIVSRINKDGNVLLGSTYVGGNENDGLNWTQEDSITNPLRFNYADEIRGEIDVDKNNNIFIATCTQSINFQTTSGVVQPAYGQGNMDGCILKFDSSLSQIRWSTYLGGTGIDALYSLAFDSKDNIYVTGGTTSSDLVTTTTAISPVYKGNIDAFVSKLSPEGKSILASTYFGSEEYDQSYFVELDFRDNVHLFGQTKAPGTTLVKNAAYSVPNSGQFICKMNESLDTLKWSTVFGNGIAEPNISPTAFLVDVCSKIYISGWGGSPKHGDLTREIKHDFTMPITKDAFFPVSKDSNDFYMMTLAFDASEVVFGSYFGGGFASEHVDGGTSRFDRKGKIYQSVCAGCGGYSDFPIKPLPGAVSERNRSRNCNNAVFKISFQMPAVIADFTTDSCQPLKFINTSLIQKDTKYDWDFGDGGKSKERSPSHTYKTPGTYRVKLFVSDYLTCNLEDSLVKSVYVSPLINDITIAASQLSFCEPETLQLFVSPSLPTLRYSWSPAEKVSNPSIANPSFYIDTTTTFTVTVTDPASSCVRTKQIEIKSSFAVKAGFQATGCTPTTFTNTSKEYKQSSYAWDFGDGASSSEKNPIHNYSKAGTYKVKLIITDPTACNEGDTIIQEVKVSEIKFFVSATTQQDTVYRKLSTQLQALPNSPDYIYQWTPEAGLSNPNISNPIATPDTSTLYTVTVTDPMSTCSNKANVRVTVIDLICDEPYIFIPNAFTPNDDLKNDKFFIKGEVFDKFNLMIYDRWGEKVFETEDKNKGWDGYFKGMKADPGVFVYYVEGTCLDQQKYKKKGNITLIR